MTARRIAIVGSFSTGKTTLAEELARRLDLPLLPEVAREIVALGFKLDKDATPETETLIFLKQLNNELEEPEFVGDRSLIDVMAYAGWVLACGIGWQATDTNPQPSWSPTWSRSSTTT